MAALQAASDPASLERGLAGSRQEVHPLRLRLRLRQAPVAAAAAGTFPCRFSSHRLNRARLDGRGPFRKRGARAARKVWVCVCHLGSFTLKQFKENKRIKKERKGS